MYLSGITISRKEYTKLYGQNRMFRTKNNGGLYTKYLFDHWQHPTTLILKLKIRNGRGGKFLVSLLGYIWYWVAPQG